MLFVHSFRRQAGWVALFALLPLQAVFAQAPGPRSALIIIDMQEKFVTRGGQAEVGDNPQRVRAVHEGILDVIQLSQQEHLPIVRLEYENYGPTVPVLEEAVQNYDETVSILKNTDDAFSQGNRNRGTLTKYLESKQVNHLVVTGANGKACVKASIRGALDEKYHVTAFETGIADFNTSPFITPFGYLVTDFAKPGDQGRFVSTNDLTRVLERIRELSTQVVLGMTEPTTQVRWAL
jgi:nicotinamidase-related amidase